MLGNQQRATREEIEELRMRLAKAASQSPQGAARNVKQLVAAGAKVSLKRTQNLVQKTFSISLRKQLHPLPTDSGLNNFRKTSWKAIQFPKKKTREPFADAVCVCAPCHGCIASSFMLARGPKSTSVVVFYGGGVQIYRFRSIYIGSSLESMLSKECCLTWKRVAFLLGFGRTTISAPALSSTLLEGSPAAQDVR